MGRPPKDGKLMSFKLSQNSIRVLKKAARRSGTSMTAVVENALDEYAMKEEINEEADSSRNGTGNADRMRKYYK